ncbi:HutD family protein [Cereibacter changlensis]|uniref:HutD family protein n=1 Tax=Cereibacter changlensis TaxID=402884 RepID=A0A4U0Z1F8_9RHOB|nr:HutD family protein [Cereibacter changlensis]TKA96936.1 HutD family protein [Cereibacter changlensis]
MRLLRAADFVPMPWANGRGVTVEMLRVEGPSGLLFRLSRASVVEDGPFSIFPGVERVLTVISGPGFDLLGERRLRCDPLAPVAFPGDEALAASGVRGPSRRPERDVGPRAAGAGGERAQGGGDRGRNGLRGGAGGSGGERRGAGPG